MAHEISDFIDSVKESLTDAQYKEGMELCQKLFKSKETEEKLYEMTYLRPYTFMDEHCDDEDCLDTKFLVAYNTIKSLILLTPARAERITEQSVFRGPKEELEHYIDPDLLRSFPNENEELGSEFEWFEFPVIKLELIS
jgi:hypothetical protein